MVEIFAVCLFINFLIFLNIEKLSVFIKLNDKPDGKLKKHKKTVPLLGGTIFFINILVFIIITIFFFKDQLIILSFSNREYFSFFFFILSFYFLGFYDDKFRLKPEKKLIIGILICIVLLTINKNLLITNFIITFYAHAIFLNNFEFFFTIFCIIILINALNFYDGINGQSLIFFIIVFSVLALKSSLTMFYLYIVFNLIFLLVLNLKNKLFLGDNGIYLIGSVLTISIIYEYNKFNSIVFVDEIFFLLILPGFDLLRLSLTRILNGKNAFYGDRNHLQHLLINKFSLFKANLILAIFALVPMILFFIINLNFFLTLIIFTILYILLIIKVSK